MRRLAAVAVVAVLAAGVVAVVLLALGARDEAPVAPTGGPGALQPDRGREHLSGSRRAQPTPPDRPPTSGPHRQDLVTRDRRELTDDQVLHALELGNVVIFYPGRRPPAALVALEQDISGPFDPEVAAAGQAVILVRRPGVGAVTAASWRRLLRANGPDDPQLREFAERWLGAAAS
jgi:hypothetical protein